MSPNVCQRRPGSGGMCWAGSHQRWTWRRPECHWHFCAALVWWARVRRPGKSLCPPEEWARRRVSFLNWTRFLPARRLDLTWASLAFAGTVRHLPPRTVTDFCVSTSLLPWGGKAVPAICWFLTAHHTSFRGCFSATAKGPMGTLVCAEKTGNHTSIMMCVFFFSWTLMR